MANIIIEGPDNSGKSTLAKALSMSTGRDIIYSGGREAFPGEINQRIRKFLKEKHRIFDRHPCVSQPIYVNIHNKTPVEEKLLAQFYSSPLILIYCRPRPERGLNGHIVKEYDKAHHIQQITENYEKLIFWYDQWALEKAHIIYRIGDNINQIIELVKGAI